MKQYGLKFEDLAGVLVGRLEYRQWPA